MPDASSGQGPRPPQDWSAAFAALPSETPPADGWSRVSARLDARGGAGTAPPHAQRARRRRWPLWAAAATVFGLIALLPIARLGDSGRATPDVASVATTKPPVAAAPRTDAPASKDAPRRVDAAPLATAPKTALASATPDRGQAAPPRKLAQDTRRSRPSARRGAKPAIDRPAPAVVTDDIALADADAAAISRWQSESAQLEALVALARDERVGNASTTVISADLDSRIGVIDAALREDALPLAQRASLWEQRVQTLRDLAGVESTQRWFAAHGERYDGALVRVD